MSVRWLVERCCLVRDGPHGRLRDLLARTAAGTRSVALVSGPAGIGKSSLVRAAVGEVEVIGWGTCVEAVAAPGYWPWCRALDAVAPPVGADATTSTRRRRRAAPRPDRPVLRATAERRSAGLRARPAAADGRGEPVARPGRGRARTGRGRARRPAVGRRVLAGAAGVRRPRSRRRRPWPLIGCYRHDELDARGAASPVAAGDVGHHASSSRGSTGRRSRCSPRDRRSAQPDPSSTSSSVVPAVTRSSPGSSPSWPGTVRAGTASRRRCATPSSDGSPACPTRPGRCFEVAALAGNAIAADVVAAAAGLRRAVVDDALAAARLGRHRHRRPRRSAPASPTTCTGRRSPPPSRPTVGSRCTSGSGIALEERAAAGASGPPRRPRPPLHSGDVRPARRRRPPGGRWRRRRPTSSRSPSARPPAHLRRWREALAASPVVVDPRDAHHRPARRGRRTARAGMTEEAPRPAAVGARPHRARAARRPAGRGRPRRRRPRRARFVSAVTRCCGASRTRSPRWRGSTPTSKPGSRRGWRGSCSTRWPPTAPGRAAERAGARPRAGRGFSRARS